MVRRVDDLEILEAHVLRAEELTVDRSDEVGVEETTVLHGFGCRKRIAVSELLLIPEGVRKRLT